MEIKRNLVRCDISQKWNFFHIYDDFFQLHTNLVFPLPDGPQIRNNLFVILIINRCKEKL